MDAEPVTILRYGAGVNSTAMLLLWLSERRRLDYVCFSDTGGERPVTLAWVERVRLWLARHHPSVTFVVVRDTTKTLEQHALDTKRLPSLAYGKRSCSVRFKIQPYIRWAIATIPPPAPVIELIGFDAGEARRVNRGEQAESSHKAHGERAKQLYPLFTDRVTREDCLRIVRATFGCVPPKSSCFFCPASSAHEVAALAVNEPDLFDRAVAIERNAFTPTREEEAGVFVGDLFTVPTLAVEIPPPERQSLWGIRANGKTWEDVGRLAQRQAAAQLPAIEGLDVPCGCADGSDDEDED